jgi:hypothetical protein
MGGPGGERDERDEHQGRADVSHGDLLARTTARDVPARAVSF